MCLHKRSQLQAVVECKNFMACGYGQCCPPACSHTHTHINTHTRTRTHAHTHTLHASQVKAGVVGVDGAVHGVQQTVRGASAPTTPRMPAQVTPRQLEKQASFRMPPPPTTPSDPPPPPPIAPPSVSTQESLPTKARHHSAGDPITPSSFGSGTAVAAVAAAAPPSPSLPHRTSEKDLLSEWSRDVQVQAPPRPNVAAAAEPVKPAGTLIS